MTAEDSLDAALERARACRLCAEDLPLGPRPVVRASTTARLLIVGQAPGTKVHETGLPFNDASGERLRDWLQMDRETFYDETRVAIMPVGLCYPGRDPKGGDRPPMRICAPTWHPVLRPLMASVELTLLVGSYAQAYYLGRRRQQNMTETVRCWRDYAPEYLPLPHPSWRNTGWLKRNPWFADDLLPELRAEVRRLVAQA
ncbi:uracil-DNA glycosylase family protein [Fodinicurvata halophila]|uniref:Uracil-DNA glycosylase family protein n=1 Tax=Fodinicurvata halophila TaxID=1419723 RepID=A0ABV8UFQ8_9PROT